MERSCGLVMDALALHGAALPAFVTPPCATRGKLPVPTESSRNRA
jgi:hypothetical protein